MTKASDTANILKQPFTNTLGTSNYRAGVNAGNTIASGGNFNVLIGGEAGTAITTGDGNTAVGFEALKTEDANGTNTAVGYRALKTLNGGADTNNTAVGNNAGAGITTGVQNTIIGALAGDSLGDADMNVAVGYNALTADTLGSRSTAIGRGALAVQNFTSATDSNNTAVGFGAGVAVSTGTLNTIIGASAGAAINTGVSNNFFGKDAGDSTTSGDKNICIGQNANNSSATADFAIVIGHDIAGASNDFSFGKASNIVSNDFDADAAFSRSSDERLKKNITDQKLGLNFINDLRTVKYNWKASGELDSTDSQLAHLRREDEDGNIINEMNTDITMHNFIAQEVKAALDTAGVSDFGGWKEDKQGVQQISREMFVIPLVKAIQELSTKNDALEKSLTSALARIKALEDA